MATIDDLKQLFSGRDILSVSSEIYGFSNFRTTRIEELTQEEIDALFEFHQPKNIEKINNALIDELLMKEWRSKILKVAEQEGIKEPNSFHKFNNWMLISSRFKKQLSQHDLHELQELYKQMCALRSNNRKSARKPLTKAWQNRANNLKNWN